MIGYSTVALGCGYVALCLLPDAPPLSQDPFTHKTAITSLATIFFASGAWSLYHIDGALHELDNSRRAHNKHSKIYPWNQKARNLKLELEKHPSRWKALMPRYSFSSWIRLGFKDFSQSNSETYEIE